MSPGSPVRALWCIYMVISSLLISSTSCYFDRGDYFWSGKPQAIGIEFSPTTITAVLTDGLGNFTTLATITPTDPEYSSYIHTIFQTRSHWQKSEIVHDDLQETAFEFKLLEWGRWMSSMAERARDRACYKLPRAIQNMDYIEKKCNPPWVFDPQPPRLRNKAAIAQRRRLQRLQTMLPKWFRTAPPTQLTKSGFLVVLVNILEEVKTIALNEHNVTITSATIARPRWLYNELGDILNEACALAGIESWEQAQDNVEMALETIEGIGNGSVLLLDHGQYHFNIYYFLWDERAKAVRCSMSVDIRNYASLWIQVALMNRVIGKSHSNVTQEDLDWLQSIEIGSIIREVMTANVNISYGTHWPQDLDFRNRTATVSLRDPTGYVLELNMTGEDVEVVSDDMADEIRDAIVGLLTIFPDKENPQEDMTDIVSQDKDVSSGEQMKEGEATENSTPTPPQAGPRLKKIEHVLVLGSILDIGLLGHAAKMATGVEMIHGPPGMCVVFTETVARGAALHALPWQDDWESATNEYLYEYEDDMYDDESIWSEEDEEQDEI
ncbi:hypothetical protein BP6252_05019 [Coleophoma cylindrospora]|uniref:Uncharacterized protein n=1 Tax=Coleophoma cylindrospora TaxID=1849047 RepID=A0A3D8RSN5_9HELO|nr:hypothetical protein BP6252_05019 [Coleophoma cylindrospora]